VSILWVLVRPISKNELGSKKPWLLSQDSEGDSIMCLMIIVKATKDSEAGVMPERSIQP
jgi:hypothetical protein